ncbi:MAG TPA: hypothetical protein VFX70_21495 [Mycobacteriales bacterium]|nr:hypothetical protein [Mycobacteriales bacterium]
MDPESGTRPPSGAADPPDHAHEYASAHGAVPGPVPGRNPDPASTVIIEAVATHPAGPRPRTVVLLPGVSGMDTPTAAAGLALALASVQPADVLLADIDPAPRPTGLATRFGLCAPEPGALLPVAPRLTYRSTRPDELAGPWPERTGLLLVHTGPMPGREALDAALTAARDAAAGTVLLLTPDTDAGARAASAALDWLDGAGCGELARGAVVVLAGDGADAGSLTDGSSTFRCRSVHRLPAAAHLVAPGVLDPDLIPDKALDTLLDLAREALDDA